jgi:hypothetical protein
VVMQLIVSAAKMQSILRCPPAIRKILRYSTQIQPNVDVEKIHLPPEKGM